jgi:GNAT superfamily N-acetyltransferase
VTIEIHPLEEKHLADAAAMFCARYRDLRKQLPLMPSRFEDPDAILSRLRDLAGQAPGVVAIRDSQLAGFLVAYQFPDFRGKPSVYAPEWANGAEMDDSRRIYEALYTALSAQWVDSGYCTHLQSVLVNDRDGLEGWRWLGFGLLGADGVRDLKPLPDATAGVDVRRAGLDDLQQVTTLMGELRQYMAQPPTFLYNEDTNSAKEDEEWLADPAHAVWLAYQGTDAVACMVQGPANPRASGIIRDRGTTSIVAAYTRETARNTGIATALLDQVLAWGRAQGYERCAVDWEPMNVLGTRFWMRHFQPVSYALVRHVDERFAPDSEGDSHV